MYLCLIARPYYCCYFFLHYSFCIFISFVHFKLHLQYTYKNWSFINKDFIFIFFYLKESFIFVIFFRITTMISDFSPLIFISLISKNLSVIDVIFLPSSLFLAIYYVSSAYADAVVHIIKFYLSLQNTPFSYFNFMVYPNNLSSCIL